MATPDSVVSAPMIPDQTVASTPPAASAGSRPADRVAGAKPASERLLSIDALRGFAMFWLIGGYNVVQALVAWIHWPPLTEAVGREMSHPPWSGFHWWDVVMPTFIFISGVTIPLSVIRHLDRGEPKSRLYWRLLRRLIILQVLNLAMYGALQHVDWSQMRFGGVLARIGWSYFLAAIIAMHTSPRQQFIWAAGILIGYWAAMTFIPVPGVEPGAMSPDGNLAGYIDRALMPGMLSGELYDRLGFYATLPTVATVLMGTLAGHWLLSNRKGGVKVIGVLSAGIICRLVAQVWSPAFPINTKMWTSSLVLAAGGWSLIILGLFYLLIDVWGLRRWAFFFVVIGMNSILIYVLPVVIDFEYAGQRLFHGLVSLLPKAAQPLALAVCVLVGIKWLLLWFLCCKRIFLRA